MKSEDIQKIIEQASKDPKFFHTLVFDPAKAVESIKSLDKDSRVSLLTNSPEFLIRSILGKLSWCGDTCGSSSCIDTCGAHSCDNTCADSCGTTCSHSCGVTTKLVMKVGDLVRERVTAIRGK